MKIDVSTGARLHFGLICGTSRSGWRYGGIGMMVRRPSWRFEVQRNFCESDSIHASEAAKGRIEEFLRKIRAHIPLGFVNIEVCDEIPFHAGLGSGTQLGLALASVAELFAFRKISSDHDKLASITERARRSAVGTYGFQGGGFLVDHGMIDGGSTKRIVKRFAVPDSWRFVLVRPASSEGLNGEEERSFFERTTQMPEPVVGELSQLIFQTIIPSLLSSDFGMFAAGLAEYGNRAGAFFADEQGGIFSHHAIRKLAGDLNAAGVDGIVQSSWGPGICIPTDSVSHANDVAGRIPPNVDGTRLFVEISDALNSGASIRSEFPDVTEGRLF